MIVLENNMTSLVPLNESVPRVIERHAAADLVYITVD
jgi:hypothetical protein